jgi:hypothetical protein
VPAVTFGVSTNFALANILASRSFVNVSVALFVCARLPRGSSNETYHVPWDLLAMRPSRGLCRRLTAVGGTSIEGQPKSFRLPPASPQESFPAVAGVGDARWPPRIKFNLMGVSGLRTYLAGGGINRSMGGLHQRALNDTLTIVDTASGNHCLSYGEIPCRLALPEDMNSKSKSPAKLLPYHRSPREE